MVVICVLKFLEYSHVLLVNQDTILSGLLANVKILVLEEYAKHVIIVHLQNVVQLEHIIYLMFVLIVDKDVMFVEMMLFVCNVKMDFT